MEVAIDPLPRQASWRITESGESGRGVVRVEEGVVKSGREGGEEWKRGSVKRMCRDCGLGGCVKRVSWRVLTGCIVKRL